MADYRKSQKSCPEETIMQVGNINKKISKEKMCRIFNTYINWQHQKYPQLITLNCAYHGDEQGAGHIHIRQVWIAHDQDGREMVHQGQCLKEMGVERPNLVKKESRYNNAKMVFTKALREKIIEIARSFGVEIEDKAQDASKSGKDLLAWQVEQDRKKTEIALAELQKIKLEQEEKLAEITKTEVYLANITEETEKEKKRAGEIKALAEAENKRLADLRVADAERQRQHEVELQNLKEKADKEEMRAKKNKALADAAEARLRQDEEWLKRANEKIDKILDKAEIATAKANAAEKREKEALERIEDLTRKKEKIDADISQLRLDEEEAELHLKITKWETEEIEENKGKSVRIISQIAEPILAVSSAIDTQNQNRVWSTVKNLVRAFSNIVDDIPVLRLIKYNRELIENQRFDEAYGNLCVAEPELTAENRGLKFLRSVTRTHGINNYNIISNAIRTVADCEGEDTEFEVDLSQKLRQTDEYKSQQTTTKKHQYYYGN